MGNNKEVFFMEDAGDFYESCHGVQWFDVSVCAVWAALMVVKELCLMLCPDRDTLLDMSARYLWVQGFKGSDKVSTTK